MSTKKSELLHRIIQLEIAYEDIFKEHKKLKESHEQVLKYAFPNMQKLELGNQNLHTPHGMPKVVDPIPVDPVNDDDMQGGCEASRLKVNRVKIADKLAESSMVLKRCKCCMVVKPTINGFCKGCI